MNRQRGFSIIAIAFILTVLAGLGVVIAQLGTTQHLGSAFANEGRQGWYAARAGLEVGRHRFASQLACPPAVPFEGMTVTLTCTYQTVVEGNHTYTVATLTSEAVGGAGTEFEIRRRASMKVWREE